MKILKRSLSIILTGLVLLSMFSTTIFAESNNEYYAYSIGVDHGSVGTMTGDFTNNVHYANMCYGLIPSITHSYYNCSPTISYMKGNNPAGFRRIASRIVFLNGHANPTTIVFNYHNLYGVFNTGVTTGSDTIKYAGLSSTNMSGVELISFVGCSTGEGIDNLPSKAVSKGATTAVGFVDAISSRTEAGQEWCKKYNDALAMNYSVAEAISYATVCSPYSNLGAYVTVYGDSTNRLIDNTVSTLSNNSNTFDSIRVNIPFIELHNFEKAAYSKCKTNLSSIVEVIKRFDGSFNAKEYNVYGNCFSEQGKTGMIVFNYVINGRIETNFAYVISVNHGVITKIDKTKIDKENVSEESLLSLVKAYKRANTEKMLLDNKVPAKDLIKEDEQFEYDYTSGNLSYEKCVYYTSTDSDNVIADIVYSEQLNK